MDLTRLAWIGFALAGGVLWGLQFGEREFLLAPWLALAPLLLLLSHPKAGRLAFLFGLASWLAAIPWIAPTLSVFGGMHWLLSLAGLALLAAYLGLYVCLFGWLGAPLWRRGPAWLALVSLPALWVALEWLRGHLLTGFPWNLAGYSWVAVPGALPATAWIGAYGLSAVVVFANASVALAVRHRRWEPAAAGLLAVLTFLALAGRFALPVVAPAAEVEGQAVRVLQPNIPNMVVADGALARRNYERVIAQSRDACDRPGALLLWPESAAWPYTFDDSPELRADLASLNAAGCPVLLNSPRQEAVQGAERWYNSALLVENGAATASYDKRHLVPFGEYVPLAGLFSFYDSLARNAGDFSAAESVHLLPWNLERGNRDRLGLAICFEVTFPEEVAATVREGATVLVTLTNDAWYGDTAAPWQHYRAARFRAAENARPLLRAAITGVSAVVGADGRPQAMLGVNQQGTLRATVRGATALTAYTRRPWLVPLACGLIALAAILLVRLQGVRFRGSAFSPPAPPA